MGRIELYRIFCRVVESGSFTRAAHAMNLPRSTVSTAVATLEARLGTTLLHRTTRVVSVTRNGEAFYTRCLALLTEQEDMEAMFVAAGSRIEGRIHVTVPSRIGRLILAPALPEFLSAWPGISVEIGMTDRAVDLPGERVDCALRVGTGAGMGGPDNSPANGPLNGPLISPVNGGTEAAARPVGRIVQINVASPAYLDAFGTPASPADLDGHVQVGYVSPTTGRVEDWEWQEGERRLNRAVPWRVSANSAEGYIACALAGMGMIQIPAYDVAPQISAGTLIEVMPGFRPQPLAVSLIFQHRQPLPRALHLFAQWLEALVQDRITGQIKA